jgi:citrate lyase subunit beta/citryl-CoA lyase
MLFVPGHNEKLMSNAAKLDVDAIIPDVEDSVLDDDKNTARQKIASKVSSGVYSGKLVFPRVNDRESGFCLKDVYSLTIDGVDGFVYPKAENKLDIYFFDKLLETIEYEKQFEIGKFKIVPLIETPAAVMNIMEICSASDRVVAVAFGCEDFMTDLGGSHDGGEALFTPRAMIAMAAKANNIVPIDTVHIDVHNLVDLEENLKLASKLGFEGMLLLHPQEIVFAHHHFTPSDVEVEEAKKLIELSEQSKDSRRGVDIVGGKFIGPPILRAARRLIERFEEINKR